MGKQVLKDLLGEEKARSILAGVAAAPRMRPGPDGRLPWLQLITGPVNPVLEEALIAEEAKLRATRPVQPAPAEKLALLRSALAGEKLDGFVVPVADEFQGEYLSRFARRLAWLSGFTGSAGMAVVLAEKAALFTDGRYSLQAGDQVDGDLFELHHITDSPPAKWITENLPRGARLGIDPWLHDMDGARRLANAARDGGGELVKVDANPVDGVWKDQPAQPLSPVEVHPLAQAGQSSAEKRRQIADKIRDEGADAVVLCGPPSIAWLGNLRGGDVPYTPLIQAYAILRNDGPLEIFLDLRKLPLGEVLEDGIRARAMEEFAGALDDLGREKACIRIDPAQTPDAVHERLKSAGAEILRSDDPCALPKACKNSAELDGARAAHIRDGVAMVRFLAWLDDEAADVGHDELSLAERLDELRAEGDMFRGLSFPTISATGSNGAIVHYKADEASNKKTQPGSLYLVDSGGQYLDGTTDLTRTLAVGEPDSEMRDRFTRVLKGHIALARARFPAGTTGSQLDGLARTSLWRAGLDYDHGTGHGVGSYLGVHEGPQGISKRPNSVVLAPGMIISNEPGYYKTGAYGIRIESLLAVTAQDAPQGAEKELLGFEVLTQVPIDLALIEDDLLDNDERVWLNSYHLGVREVISPLVDAPTQAWLEHATRAIGA